MVTLTPELREEIAKAGEQPVRIEDPETHLAYVLVREDVYRRLQELEVVEEIDPSCFEFDDFEPLEK
jgi:hypothetical protein